MEEENFDDLIDNISEQLKMYVEMYENEKNDINYGIVHGMYYVADSIQNMLIIQNETNDENKYENFINLVEDIEKRYILKS